MQAKLTNTRTFAIRTMGIAAIAASAMMFAPMNLALADDDDPLPGAPIIRSSAPGVVNAGPSDVRAPDMNAPLRRVTQNTNGGGLVKDGNLFVPGGPAHPGGHKTLCDSAKTLVGYGNAADGVDCGSDFRPYN